MRAASWTTRAHFHDLRRQQRAGGPAQQRRQPLLAAAVAAVDAAHAGMRRLMLCRGNYY